jgi:hypothetical protein
VPNDRTKSGWQHFKTRGKRAGGLSLKQDIFVAVLTALIGYFVLDVKSARDAAVALAIGLAAGVVWQLLRFVWRFLWTVPREFEAERDDALAKLEGKTGMPPYHPKIVADRYGRQGLNCGLFIANDGYPAYEISIPDVAIGTSCRLTFPRTLPRLIDKQGEQFFDAWIECSDSAGRDGSALHSEMVDTNTDALTVSIIYHDGEYNKDGEFNWYKSNFSIARDASVGNGLSVSFLSQKLIRKPSTG